MKATIAGARKLCKDLHRQCDCHIHISIDFDIYGPKSKAEEINVYVASSGRASDTYYSIEEARKACLKNT